MGSMERATDLALPGSERPHRLPFLMYPNGEDRRRAARSADANSCQSTPITAARPGWRCSTALRLRGLTPLELAAANGASTARGLIEASRVVWNFWRRWCDPCRAELPSLERLRTASRAAREVLVCSRGAARASAGHRGEAGAAIISPPRSRLRATKAWGVSSCHDFSHRARTGAIAFTAQGEWTGRPQVRPQNRRAPASLVQNFDLIARFRVPPCGWQRVPLSAAQGWSRSSYRAIARPAAEARSMASLSQRRPRPCRAPPPRRAGQVCRDALTEIARFKRAQERPPRPHRNLRELAACDSRARTERRPAIRVAPAPNDS